jgi:hypothetical protein
MKYEFAVNALYYRITSNLRGRLIYDAYHFQKGIFRKKNFFARKYISLSTKFTTLEIFALQGHDAAQSGNSVLVVRRGHLFLGENGVFVAFEERKTIQRI